VVGWLVCIDGVDKGRDYRIHTGNNFIGRAPNMDIAIRNDNAVSSIKHATISYDMRGRAYYFAQGDGVNIVYLNGKPVLSMVQLNAYDKIEIGRTTLLFVPLCGEAFNWVDLAN
jgi:predicted component of type VI protein secretion system